MSASVTTTEMLVSAGSDDLTQMGYFADASYLRWVQAVVIMHWERFAPPAALASTLWIAVRHKIVPDMNGRPKLGGGEGRLNDRLWVNCQAGPFADRTATCALLLQ